MTRQNSTTVSNARLNARLTQRGYKLILKEIALLEQSVSDCDYFIQLLLAAHEGSTDSAAARIAEHCINRLSSPLETLRAILEPLPVAEDSHE